MGLENAFLQEEGDSEGLPTGVPVSRDHLLHVLLRPEAEQLSFTARQAMVLSYYTMLSEHAPIS